MDDSKFEVHNRRLLMEAARDHEEFGRWQDAARLRARARRRAPPWTSASDAFLDAKRLRRAVDGGD